MLILMKKDNYIKRLLDCGKKIAICEQMELSDNSKALARREVVRIVTPATVVDEDFLDDKSFNYIICFFQHALAFCDVSTGDFHIRALDPKNKAQSVRTALQQIAGITELAVEQADAYVTNGTKPETEKQLVPCVAITAENVEFLNAFVYTGE